MAGEVVISVFGGDNQIRMDRLLWLRTLVAVLLLALLVGVVQWRRRAERSKGTFYYLEMRDTADRHSQFVDARGSAERHAMQSRALVRHLPFAWGVLDAREPAQELLRDLMWEMNADDHTTSFNIACNMIEVLALSIGYTAPLRAETRLFELGEGKDSRRHIVNYCPDAEDEPDSEAAEFDTWVGVPYTEDGTHTFDEIEDIDAATRNNRVQRVLVTVRAQSSMQECGEVGEMIGTDKRLPEAEFFDRCAVICLRDDEGAPLPYRLPSARDGRAAADPDFQRVDPHRLAHDVASIRDRLATIYAKYPDRKSTR